MPFVIGQKIHGFILTHTHFVHELESAAYLFEHEKSGARLLYLSNADENKVFSVNFKTVPSDSTGVAHIIEHTLLCGSEKYPLKEPFVELVKGSMNTFLNAMTFPDKTMYPVASTNDQDFLNLIDVYLDGIFNPLILQSPLSFWQEGWHYELASKDSELTMGGVVYSEMQGAYSNPEDALENAVMASLFPDSVYSHDSGGDPDHIPELTYEAFIDFYQRHYAPQNSYFFFYGNGDVEEHLRFIEERYVSHLERLDPFKEPVIAKQAPFAAPCRSEVAFDCSTESEKENILSVNYVIGDAHDRELIMGMEILDKILFDSESSPLKKALIASGIGAEYQFNYTDGILQPILSIIAKQAGLEDETRFIDTVESALERIAKEGLDPELIDASINHYEFLLREVDNTGHPKGVLYAVSAMSSWLYGDMPWKALEYESALASIKAKAHEGYFESLITEYILHNTHRSYVVMKATKGLNRQKQEEKKAALAARKAAMSVEEVDFILSNTKTLNDHQSAVESEEVKNTIPCIKPHQVEKLPKQFGLAQWNQDGFEGFLHTDQCRGIAYLDVHFPISHLSKEELPYLALLCKCLGWFRTKQHSSAELHLLISQLLGDISFNFNILDPKGWDSLDPYFTMSVKGLFEKQQQFFPLIEEVLTQTLIDDADQLYYTLSEEFSQQKNKALSSAHSFASARLKSYFEPRLAMGEYICGVDYFNFLADLMEHFDSRKESLMLQLNMLMKKVLVSGGVKVLLVCDPTAAEALEASVKTLCSGLEQCELAPVPFVFAKENKNEGFIIPSNVYYVAAGFNYKLLGYKSCGELLVLRKYLSTEYLWNTIRAMGGAYGAMASIDLLGNFSFVTYRDPHLSRTLDAYAKIPQEIKSFSASPSQIDRMIIGTISDLDTPLSPYGRGKSAFIHHCRSYSFEKRAKRREEVLSASAQKIRDLFDLSVACMEQNALCVFGRDEKINACEALCQKKVLF